MQDFFDEELEALLSEEDDVEDAERAKAEAEAKAAEEKAAEEAKAVEEAAETAEEAEEVTEEAPEEDKGFFKKKKTDKKQDALKEKVDELEDKVKRQMAEFDNFRRRTEKEKSAMFETGAKSVIEKILPVVDNFERGLASISEEEKETGFAAGMNMIYKQLMEELNKIGVTPIEAIGKEFDPNFHNAVMQVESEEYEEGIVAQELLKGYMYRDTVVRHSCVAVVQ